MKVGIVRTLDQGELFTDADTGQVGAERDRLSKPVRVLAQATPQPAAPSDDEIDAVVDKIDVNALRTVLAYPYHDRGDTVRFLVSLLNVDPDTALSLAKRGSRYVVSHYLDTERARERLRLETAWHERIERWAIAEARRKASLRFWVFRNKMVEVDGWESCNRDEVVARIKHKILSEEDAFAKVQREIELLENIEVGRSIRRDPIPQDVQIFVWRRDEQRCVKCGSQERLEFDHIIPLALGGGNTARNIQLLCEGCNREKGTRI